MIHEENSAEVGLYLRDCRRAQGISIEEVAGRTKIRVVMLRQLETGDLSQIPPTYIKGFIRAYGEAVGADVQEAFRRFELNRPVNSRFEQVKAPPKYSSGTFWRRLLAALLVFAVLIAATLFIADFFKEPERPATPQGQVQNQMQPAPVIPANEPEPPGIAAPDSNAVAGENPEADLPRAVEVPADGDSRPPEAEVPQVAPQAALSAALVPPGVANDVAQGVAATDGSDRLILQLKAVEQTWMRVTRDDAPPREITLKADDQVTLEAQQRFELLIGNAGGLRLKLNDEPERFAGAKGKVVRLVFP